MVINVSHDIIYNNQDPNQTGKSGIKITVDFGSNINVEAIYKHAECTATKGYILDASKSTLATGDFVGDKCTFSSPYTLTNTTTYYFAVDNDGSNYDTKQHQSVSLPIDGDGYFDWIIGMDAAENDRASRLYSILACDLSDISINTNMKINIGDTWKDVDSMQINIGDVWKDVVKVQQNIGDSWKDVF
ncbi:MAG: hypothetical protein QQN41_00040 [Nitrosopumilus sp.]